VIRLFKETHYFPDYNKLILNIINDCEICNLAKTEHRPTKLVSEITPETKTHEKFMLLTFMQMTIKSIYLVQTYIQNLLHLLKQTVEIG